MFIENTQIYLDENFLTEEELAFFDKVIEDNSDLIDSFDENTTYKAIKTNKKSVSKKISYRIQNILLQTYPDKAISRMYPRNELELLGPGDEITEHNDAEGQNIIFGAFVYISDENSYVGGELNFPRLELEVKPKRGSLVIVPRENDYTHNVNKVESGNRFVLVTLAAGE